jgi:N-acetylmuramic acid 6-phosphate etherase
MSAEQQVNEQGGAELASFDGQSDAAVLKALLDGQERALAAVRRALPQIADAANALAQGLKSGGRLVYAGAGSSIAIGAQDGAELPVTFGLDPARVIFLIAGGRSALLDIDGAAEDDAEAGRREARALNLAPSDTLVAVSASGTTPYTLGAAEAALAAGARVIGIASTPGAPLLALATLPVLLETGPEVIAGSTRLGAGTAQKCALGLISSLAHIRLGAVVAGHMVRMRPTNAKLRARAIGIVADLGGVAYDAARQALALSGNDIEAAVLIARGLGDAAEARRLLCEHDGNLAGALRASG